MTAVAGDHLPVDPPRPAEHGVRWTDVPIAMEYASAAVEMAVTRRTEEADRYVFELKTVDDRPGRMTVRRTDNDRIYEAEATVGRFDLANDRILAERLLAAFDRQMHQFGKKRTLPMIDDEAR